MFANSRYGKKLCTPVFDQSLTGMVRAILPKAKFSCGLREGGPSPKHSLWRCRCELHREPSDAKRDDFCAAVVIYPHLTGQSTTSRKRERTGHLTQSIGWLAASAGSPKGREPYGDGKPIVVLRRICEK
ncbi:MAG: hypothetical protein ACE5OZ_03100 [Candidatus Heimdallarchaeota archaeon]